MYGLEPVVAQALSAGDRLLSTLINGLALGAVYSLLALGFVIIFKATQVVNFAHGAMAALGAYFVSYFAVTLNVPGKWIPGAPLTLQWILSAIIAMGVMAIFGLVVERVAIRPMIGQPLFSVAMITIGLEVIVRTTTNDLIENTIRPVGDPWLFAAFQFGNVRLFHTQIAMVAAAILAMGLLAIFFKSRTGIAMRATAFDQEAAMAQGIRVGTVFALAWVIGSILAAVGGVFTSVAPRAAGVGPFTPFIVFRAFPAVILGGLDSVIGAIIGGFVIGLAEVGAGNYLTFSWLGTGFSGVVPFILMLVVLLIRPYGLFGTAEIRRV